MYFHYILGAPLEILTIASYILVNLAEGKGKTDYYQVRFEGSTFNSRTEWFIDIFILQYKRIFSL